MKRILLFIFGIMWLHCHAQKVFEGTLFIEVVSADSLEIPKMNFEVKLKGSVARMNIHSENIDDYSLIINYETGESIMLKTYNGEKIAVRGMKPLAETGSFSEEKSKFQKVAGYNCRKGKITTNQGSSEVYYYPSFTSPAQFFGAYSNVPGLILELHLQKEGNVQIVRTKKISRRKVKDDEFIVPNEYREMSESEYLLLLPLFPEMLK
jgi:hypothetical protein